MRTVHAAIGAALLALAGTLGADSASGPQRVVSVDGALTEIVYALGASHRLFGVGTSSRYPRATEDLSKVGYKRALSAEGLLSLSPDLVPATDDAGLPGVLEQIALSGVPTCLISDPPTVAGLHAKISAIAEVLDPGDAAAPQSAAVDADLAEATAPAAASTRIAGSRCR